MKPEVGRVNVKKEHSLFMCIYKEEIVFVSFLPWKNMVWFYKILIFLFKENQKLNLESLNIGRRCPFPCFYWPLLINTKFGRVLKENFIPALWRHHPLHLVVDLHNRFQNFPSQFYLTRSTLANLIFDNCLDQDVKADTEKSCARYLKVDYSNLTIHVAHYL